MANIEIKGKSYKLKYTLRALFIFERLAKHQFEITSLMDNYILLYSVLLANNPDMDMTWDNFIDTMDEDPSLFTKMNELINKDTEKNEVFTDDEKEGKEDKEKKE